MKPPTIDITPQAGRRAGATNKGIFEVKGDELKLCYDRMGGERPKKFDTSGPTVILATLKREAAGKSETKPK
jgi:hypothetical protein